MKKTREQKIASKERFLAQETKAKEMLSADNLYEFINGLKYAYSLSIRYKSVNLRELVDSASFFNPFFDEPKTPVQKCLKASILKPWNNTYWFDKEKAESLQQYILEHQQN